MSTDDRTPPEGEGRTVATDADQAPKPTAASPDVPPSPTPRPAEPAQAPPAAPAVPAPPATAPPAPGPAPAAAEEPAAESAVSAPPPWRRVPDAHEGANGDQPTVADSLLSEAPTAFLTAPDTAAGPSSGGGTATATRDPENRAAGADVPRASVRNRPPRQALLQLKRLDPWSVLKMALALAVVLWLVWMVAAGVLYGVLGGMGVWDRLNGTYADLVTGQEETGGSLISAGRVFGLAAIIGAVNSLLFAVAVTIVAFVYNVAADLVGGIEVTLSERD
ncbi:DUF3566 domain-containing protein [Pseudonocardia sp. HH130630-07]|uniref:DUF3566 domain-containing protein n=1 Tax=Pseudonocardia sp. HH130630-07 TaxID=1690815 RepID=UPI000814BF83|nr:DUF3566 domain-containing protein [Pseudonocardia sp. HH130630-07]ANY06755.1 hypothetical protein AFB00_11145 [Pseudonocardia sp. HH130630-07]